MLVFLISVLAPVIIYNRGRKTKKSEKNQSLNPTPFPEKKRFLIRTLHHKASGI